MSTIRARLFLLLGLSLSAFCTGFSQRPPRTFDLLDVSWRLSFNEKQMSIAGDVTNTLRPLSDGMKSVVLDCGPLQINAVSVNGKPAKWNWKNELLTIDLAKPAKATDVLKVRTQYSGVPTAGIYFVPPERAFPGRTGVVYTQGEMVDTRYWLPTYDEPDDKATSEAFIEVPKSYTAISNGQLVGVTDTSQGKLFHWKMDQPHSTYLISLVAGEYEEGKEMWDKLPVSWYVPKGLTAAGKAAFGGTADMVKFYSQLTGIKYPYAKFCQCAVPDYMFGGMENITAVTQTIGTLHDPKEEPFANSEGLVLHELAHQWFGDTATCSDWSNCWLNEGFASFLPSFYVRMKHGEEAYDLSRYGTFQGGLFGMMGSHRPMVSDKYEEPIDMFDGNAYPGGASRMFMLMNLLGEDRFWKGIQTYLTTYKFANANTDQFFDVMAKSSGVNLDTFKKQWFYTAATPQITVSRDGSSIMLKQKSPYFVLDVPIAILDGDKWIEKSLAINGEQARLALGPYAGRPVLVDPNVQLMMGLTYDLGYSAQDWANLYRHASNAAQKARILEKLYSEPATLLELAKEEKSPRMLAMMIGSLREEAEEFVLDCSRHEDREVQIAAVRRLGDLPKSDGSISRLKELWQSDPSDLMKQAALSALYSLTKDSQLLDQAWSMDGHQDTFRVFALNTWAGVSPDEARNKALGILKGGHSEPLRVAAINVLGRVKDKPGETRVFEALCAVAREPSFGARISAIRILGGFGNKAAIPSIEPATHHSLHFMRRAAAAAIKQLGG